ncbi:MAG: post-PEP-CTERM-1 domain-containing protein, partial [Candidatus Eisenbacteria bacterium]
MRCAPPLLVSLVFVALASVAGAASLPPILHGRPRPWQPPISTMAAMRVAIDPITGELVPIASGDPSLVPLARTVPPGGFTIRTRPDGSGSVYLGDAIRAYTVVRLNAAGDLVEDCVQVH